MTGTRDLLRLALAVFDWPGVPAATSFLSCIIILLLFLTTLSPAYNLPCRVYSVQNQLLRVSVFEIYLTNSRFFARRLSMCLSAPTLSSFDPARSAGCFAPLLTSYTPASSSFNLADPLITSPAAFVPTSLRETSIDDVIWLAVRRPS